MIILLNFLIAMVGQSYDNVVAESLYFEYKFKSDLNKECYHIANFLMDYIGKSQDYFVEFNLIII